MDPQSSSPEQLEIVHSRLDAPLSLVFDVFTKPKHVRNWFAPFVRGDGVRDRPARRRTPRRLRDRETETQCSFRGTSWRSSRTNPDHLATSSCSKRSPDADAVGPSICTTDGVTSLTMTIVFRNYSRPRHMGNETDHRAVSTTWRILPGHCSSERKLSPRNHAPARLQCSVASGRCLLGNSSLNVIALGDGAIVRVDRDNRVEIVKAYGLAHRSYDIPNEVDTRFALASGTRGLTALTVVSLVEDGTLQLTTRARSVWKDIPLVGNGVIVEHLLAHRSGIGDDLDEEAGLDLDEYLMPVPVHELATTEDYLAVLDGHPPKFAPGERFAYCNSGYVVLALIAERATALPSTSSCSAASASARGCATPRSCARTSSRLERLAATSEATTRGGRDASSARPRIGEAASTRPPLTSGHSGQCSRRKDRVARWVAGMVRPCSDVSSQSRRYGLGFRLHRPSTPCC